MKLWTVDAFIDKPFQGNSVAVTVLRNFQPMTFVKR